MRVQVDHVQIAAPRGCEPAARRFYGELIGLEEVPKPASLGPGVWFVTDGPGIHIGIEEPFRPARKAHVAFRTADPDEMARRLEAAGHQVRWNDGLESVRRFFTHDPWGNRVEITTGQGARAGRPR